MVFSFDTAKPRTIHVKIKIVELWQETAVADHLIDLRIAL